MIVGVVICVLLGVGYFKYANVTKLPLLRPTPQPLPAGPDQVRLSTIPGTGSFRESLLGADFSVVNRLGEVPEGCKGIFRSAFVTPAGSPSSAALIQVADPNQPFNSTDDVTTGLPFRRLIFAGLSHQSCFIYYERGGSMYPSSCLAVIDYAQQKSVWIGESRKKARNLDDLRFMLSNGDFQDNEGPVC